MANGQQAAAENLQRFRDWIQERDKENDWPDYLRGNKLSRTDVARECKFGTSALRQNPAIKAELEQLEARLLGQFTQEGSVATEQNVSDKAVSERIMTVNKQAEHRIKTLEESNAALRAAVEELQTKLERYQHLELHLAETGRMVRP